MKQHNINERSDARYYAALVLQNFEKKVLDDSFYCYGTEKSILIGINRASSLVIESSDTLDSVWSQINKFIETNKSEYIFGFVGFDPANLLNKSIEAYQQKIDLFVPEIVIECRQSGCTVKKGIADIGNIDGDLDLEKLTPIDIREIDKVDQRKKYKASVTDVINSINIGSIERATLARKIYADCEFDLTGTFLSDHSQHDIARSFYFSSQYIAFAGQSPELLAEGNVSSFSTHKLSGTHAKNMSKRKCEFESNFKKDLRITEEHKSAIAPIENSLTNLGRVKTTRFKIMELPVLIHGWTEFVTSPEKNKTIADCLRSVFPFGVNPMVPGLELLSLYEDFCRGPYYGITGCILPDGEFSFAQVLRSAFIDNESSYLMAGAAITALSTPELEVRETCTKLYGVEVYEQIT